MKIYHSTSLKNANKIIKDGFINPFTYFADNYNVSRYYGSMVSGKVVTFEVEIKENEKENFIFSDYIQNKNKITQFTKVKF